MSETHVAIAKAVRELPVGEICSLIEDHSCDKDIAVMDRLVMGAVAAPILVQHIRATLRIVEAYGARARAAGAHEAEAAALGIAKELREHGTPQATDESGT